MALGAEMVMTAGVALTAVSGPALAADRADLYGRWAPAQFMNICQAPADEAEQPLTVSGDTIGTAVWLCTVEKWDERGAFHRAQASCGEEGEGTITREEMLLALSTDSQLVFISGNAVHIYKSCEGK